MPDAPAPIPNRWTPFGLKDDPFFQEELGPRATDAYPVARYFVGREDEVRALVHRVGGARSSRTVVEGDAGVGKASFVNRVKHDLAAHGVRTHEQPIRVTSETTLQSFVGDLLRVLLAMHAARGTEPGGDDEAALWGKVARIAEGQFLRGGGVGAAGFPVSTSVTNIAPQAAGDLYHDEVRAAVRTLAGVVTLTLRRRSRACGGGGRRLSAALGHARAGRHVARRGRPARGVTPGAGPRSQRAHRLPRRRQRDRAARPCSPTFATLLPPWPAPLGAHRSVNALRCFPGSLGYLMVGTLSS